MPDAAALALDARALSATSRGPWTSEQLSRVIVANLAGAAAIVGGAYGASRASDTQQALLWFNIGVGALALVGIANARWLLQSRRIFTLGRNIVLQEVRVVLAGAPTPSSTTASGSPLLWSPGTHRYHRPDCRFVQARPTQPVTPAMVAAMPLQACEVCRP